MTVRCDTTGKCRSLNVKVKIQKMEISEKMVSFFPQLRDTGNSVAVAIGKILEAIRDGKWKSQIEKLRAAPSKTAKAKLKNNLPNFTGSGTFTSRKSSGLIDHSNLIVLDIDKLEALEAAREQVIQDKYTYACFESCSGNGLAVIVQIEGNRHAESYVALSAYYKEQFGLIVDPSCKDVARTRFVSYDPNLFVNVDAEIFTVPEKSKVSASSADVTPNQNDTYSKQWSNQKKYDWCKKIIDRKKSYVDGERHAYLFALSSFLNKVGVGESFATKQMVSDHAMKSQTTAEIKSIVAHCFKRTAEHGTFKITVDGFDVPKVGNDKALQGVYRDVNKSNREGKSWGQTDVDFISEKHKVVPDVVRNIFEFIYKSNVDEFGLKHKLKIKQVEILLTKTFDFRDNIVSGQQEFRRKAEAEFQPLNPSTIHRFLQHRGISYALLELKSLLKSDFIPKYNAFVELFKAFPKWDGKTDHIGNLASHVCAEHQEFFDTQFKKMMVRCVACSVYGEVNRMIFVLISPKQELGKSTFIRFLNPFKKIGYTEAPLRNNKDALIRMSENFIYNLEELSSLNVKNVNALKAIISVEMTKERRPFGHFEEERPRRCNFFGSSNQTEFLADVSNTRWLCFNITDIDWKYKKEIDIQKAWAQAYRLYHDGFDYQLTLEERKFRDEINRTFELRSDESDLILNHLYPIEKDHESAVFMSVADIITFLSTETRSPFKMNRYAVGRAMAQFQFKAHRKTVNGNQARGYWVGLIKDRPKPAIKAISPKGDLLSEFDL